MTKAERSAIIRKAKSPPASLPFKGKVTEQRTVKWSIKKRQATSMSCNPEPTICSRDTSQQMAVFDSCQVTITRMPKIQDVTIIRRCSVRHNPLPFFSMSRSWMNLLHFLQYNTLLIPESFGITLRACIKPFYSYLLSNVVFEWQREWRSPCFDEDLTFLLCKSSCSKVISRYF